VRVCATASPESSPATSQSPARQATASRSERAAVLSSLTTRGSGLQAIIEADEKSMVRE